MTHTVTLLDQTTSTTNEDETVFVAATRQNLNLPHSYKDDAYGQHKTELISGGSEMGKYIDKAISEEKRAQGRVLLCCTTAKSDLKINAPGFSQNVLPVRTLPVHIESIRIKRDVALLKLALPKAPLFAFYIGQYINLLLPGSISRSHSIANSSDREGILGLHIRKCKNGICSEMIFNVGSEVKEKDIAYVKGPLGVLILQQDSSKPMILLTTGTGYTPIRSILLDLIRRNSERQVHFYWGARQQADLYALEEVEALIGRLEDARFSPAFSKSDSEWKGRNGYVQDVAAQNYPDLDQYGVYTRGSPEMTGSTRGLLTQKCASPKDAFSYDTSSLAQEHTLRNSYA